jgi:hypothetical protein
MEQSDGPATADTADGRFGGRWRYDRRSGRGIALSYYRGAGGGSAADQHVGARWRFHRLAGRGIAVRYERPRPDPPVTEARPPSAPAPVPPAPPAPPALLPRAEIAEHDGVRVLCFCGEFFSFDGDQGLCPNCGRCADWPTMGVVEREMRADLDELLSGHDEG